MHEACKPGMEHIIYFSHTLKHRVDKGGRREEMVYLDSRPGEVLMFVSVSQ